MSISECSQSIHHLCIGMACMIPYLYKTHTHTHTTTTSSREGFQRGQIDLGNMRISLQKYFSNSYLSTNYISIHIRMHTHTHTLSLSLLTTTKYLVTWPSHWKGQRKLSLSLSMCTLCTVQTLCRGTSLICTERCHPTTPCSQDTHTQTLSRFQPVVFFVHTVQSTISS